MGQRYGSRPLPVKIPKEELDLITQVLRETSNVQSIPLIEKWYKLDENALPPEYVLQSLTTIGKNNLQEAEIQKPRDEHTEPSNVKKIF